MSPTLAFALVTLLMPNGTHQVSRVPLPFTQQCDEDGCTDADAHAACDVLAGNQKDLAKLLGGKKVLVIACTVLDGSDPERSA